MGGEWQLDPDLGAHTELAVYRDVATVHLYNLTGHRETPPRADAASSWTESGFENLGQYIGGNPRAVVRDGDENVLAFDASADPELVSLFSDLDSVAQHAGQYFDDTLGVAHDTRLRPELFDDLRAGPAAL